MYVIILQSSISAIGPFTSEQEAIDYAKLTFHSTKWFVRPIVRC